MLLKSTFLALKKVVQIVQMGGGFGDIEKVEVWSGYTDALLTHKLTDFER